MGTDWGVREGSALGPTPTRRESLRVAPYPALPPDPRCVCVGASLWERYSTCVYVIL